MNKKRKATGKLTGRRILSVFLSIQMILSGVPGGMPGTLMTVNANAPQDPVSYVDHTINGNTAEETEKECDEYVVLSGDASTSWENAWYVVNTPATENDGKGLVINDRITVSGTVNLILCDGARLTASEGITVQYADTDNDGKSDNVMNIYGQTAGTGELVSTSIADDSSSSIGGGSYGDNGEINFHGGIITATCGGDGAGIGGGSDGEGGNVTVYGGTITAKGGSIGAGIGGAYDDGGNVTIYGGTVTATGGANGAGIGGGCSGSGGKVTVYGGTITATGGENGAGIGSGNNDDGGDITIYGGSVTATGGENGAGIGGGNRGAGENITIYGGTVTATGGENGAGIGGGEERDGGTVTVYGGEVTAKSKNGAGIGGGYYANGGEVFVHGGKVMAESEEGAGIGGGQEDYYNNNTGKGGLVTVYGGMIKTKGCENGEGIGGSEWRTGTGTLVLNNGELTTLYISNKENPEYNDANIKPPGNTDRYMTVIHRHDCTYTLSESKESITKRCRADKCSLKLFESILSIAKPAKTVYGDGKSAAAVLSDPDDIKDTADVVYYRSNEAGTDKVGEALAAAPENAGKYRAEITLGTATAYVVYDIAKAAAPVITNGQKPSAKTGVEYSGTAQALVTAPADALDDYTINYSTDGGATWSAEIPSATAAGSYTVKVKYVNNSGNYEDFASEDLSVSISKAAPVLTDARKPSAVKDLKYTGTAQALVTAPAGVTVRYALGTDAENAPAADAYVAAVPTGTNAGTYYVWYIVTIDENHFDTAPQCVTVTVEKAVADIVLPKAAEAVYSGEKQALLQTGTAAGGKIFYFLGNNDTDKPADDAEWSEAIPTGTDAGTYYIWVKLETAADNIVTCVKAEIKKAETVVKTAPKAVTGLYMTGKDQALITAGEATGGKLVYSLASGNGYSDSLPLAKYAGEYTVYYKVLGDSNHNDSKEFSLKSVIAESPGNPIISVSANLTELHMVKGEKFYLPETGWAVKYKADRKYVSIDAKGLITAKKVTAAGGVEIEKDGRVIKVSVTMPEMKEKKHSMKTGETWTVPFKYDTDNHVVQWYSEDQDVATVDNGGTVTATGAGKTKVYAVIKGVRYSCTISVKENKEAVTERTLHMNIGAKKSVSIKGVKIASLDSADPKIISVKNKKLKAEGAGETTVTVNAKDGKTYKLHVFVEDPTIVSDIVKQANKKGTYTLTLKQGETAELKYKSLYQTINYENTKPFVAYETGYGLIAAGMPGTTRLSAKVNGKKISINVTVTEK